MSVKRALKLSAPATERASKRRAIEPQREPAFHLWGDFLWEIQQKILSFLYPPDRYRFSKISSRTRFVHTHAETRQWFVLADLKKELHRFDFLPENQIDSLSFKMLFGTNTPTLKQLQFTRVLTSYVSQSHSMRIMRNPLHHVHEYPQIKEIDAYGYWHIVFSKWISFMGGRFIPILFEPNKLLANESTITLIKEFIVKFYSAIEDEGDASEDEEDVSEEEKGGIFASPAYVNLISRLRAEGFQATVSTLPFPDLRDDERKSKLDMANFGVASSEVKHALMISFNVREESFQSTDKPSDADDQAIAVKLWGSYVCRAFFRDDPRTAKKVYDEIAQFPLMEKNQFLGLAQKVFHPRAGFVYQKLFARKLTQLIGFHPVMQRCGESSQTYLILKSAGSLGLLPAMLTDHIEADPALFEKAFVELDAWFPFFDAWEIDDAALATLLYGCLKYLTASPCVYEDESAPFTTDLSFSQRARVVGKFFTLLGENATFFNVMVNFFKYYAREAFSMESEEFNFEESKKLPDNHHYLFIEMIVLMSHIDQAWMAVFEFMFDTGNVPRHTWRNCYCLVHHVLSDWLERAKHCFLEPNPTQFMAMRRFFQAEKFAELMKEVLIMLVTHYHISSIDTPKLKVFADFLSPASMLWDEPLAEIAKVLFERRTRADKAINPFARGNPKSQLLSAIMLSKTTRDRIRRIPESCVHFLCISDFMIMLYGEDSHLGDFYGQIAGFHTNSLLPWINFLVLYTSDTLFNQLITELPAIEGLLKNGNAEAGVEMAKEALLQLGQKYNLSRVYKPLKEITDVETLFKAREQRIPALQQLARLLLQPPPAPDVPEAELNAFMESVLNFK